MYNMRFNAILKGLIIGLASIFIMSCERVDNTPSTPVDNISIMLDVDELSLESASIRVRHDGDPNALWVYMNTLDMESDAAKLLTEKLLVDVEYQQEIVAYKGKNISVSLTKLLPKTYYRFICGVIDDVTGELKGAPAEISYRTRRDPAYFEINANWEVQRGSRTVGTDGMEYDNFICKSSDDETYVLLPIKKADFESSYKSNEVSLFNDFYQDFALAVGDSQWKKIVKSGDVTITEDRLRSGDWNVYMLGIGTDGELSGLYQQTTFKIEMEEQSEAYKRWLGTWKVTDRTGATEYFEVSILPSEHNLWYYLAGWESNNMYGYPTDDSALMFETFFDKSNGSMSFVSQYVNTAEENGEYRDFYFKGSFSYGQNYVIDLLNFRMADAKFTENDYSEAMVTGNNYSIDAQTSFPIKEICYIYYLGGGSNPAAISQDPPDLPLMLKRVK